MKAGNILYLILCRWGVVSLLSLLLFSCSSMHNKNDWNISDIYPDLPKVNIENIYVFGDSLSDNGNFFSQVSHLVEIFDVHLKAPPAAKGGERFSNKFLPVEYVAAHYGIYLQPAWGRAEHSRGTLSDQMRNKKENLPGIITALSDPTRSTQLTQEQEGHVIRAAQKHEAVVRKDVDDKGLNYAFSNATIGSYSGAVNRFFDAYNLHNQLDLYLNNVDSDNIGKSSTLHIIIIGGNDIMRIASSSSGISDMMRQIDAVAQIYVTQISRLVDSGAKKIMISTAPMIGDIPAFHPFEHSSDIANQLSARLDSKVKTQVANRFAKSNVRFFSIAEIFNKVIGQWPDDKKYIGCINDIADGYFSLLHFLLTDGELATKFVNNCNEKLLTDGAFPFFDSYHGTHALYQKIVPFYIMAVNDLFASS